ncbi:MAG TPA: protein kinase, partial [Candidatus Eremiobacteraeota bacterium]|nr:protein kinase [Candidatus Eremiobacteraeota bacterium]
LCDYYGTKKNNSETDNLIWDFLQDQHDLSSWFEILKHILRTYKQRKEEFFLPELLNFMFDDAGNPTENYEKLEEVIRIVNKFDSKGYEAEKQSTFYFEKLEILLIELLEELSFLQEYPLIKPIVITPYGDNFVMNAYRCMGSNTNFKDDRINCSSLFSLQKIHLLRPKKKEVLELYPLFLSHTCAECRRTHLFIFDHILYDTINYIYPLENHRLSSPDFKKDVEQFLNRKLLLRKKIDYSDIWKDMSYYKEKNLGGKYKLLELVGSGGMGDVYKALQTNLGAIRALKILPKNLSSNIKYIRRFEREARLAGRLEHENIVRVIDVEETDTERFIVMEYIEGRTLRDILIEKVCLPEEQVINLAISIASGLCWIHQNDIIHRDIKPENIMIDINNKVKITDFGISKATGSTRFTAVGVPIGTAQYLSPEQAGGPGEVSFYSDIYSLGVVIYEMLTGTFPYEFKDDNPISIAICVISSPVIPIKDKLPQISQDMESIVMKCLEKDPVNRYKNASELMEDMQKLIEKRKKADITNKLITKGKTENSRPFLEGLRWSSAPVQRRTDFSGEEKISIDEAKRIAEEIEDKFKDMVDLTVKGKHIPPIVRTSDPGISSEESNKILTENEYEYTSIVESFLSKGYMTAQEKEYIKFEKERLNISTEQNLKIFSEVKNKYKEKIDKIISKRGNGQKIKQFLKVTKKEEKALSYLDSGKYYYDKKNYNSAIEEYKKGLDFADMPEIHNYLGEAYYALGRIEMAIKEFEKTISIEPDNAIAINNLKYLYVEIKKRSKATRKWKEKIEDLSNKLEDDYLIKEEERIKKASNSYRQFVEDLREKSYLTDKELEKLEEQKNSLNLPDEIAHDIEKDIQDKIHARESSKLEMLDMAITNYRRFLENLWSKGSLTEEDKKYIILQQKEYNLPDDIALQILKEVELATRTKDKEGLEKSLAGYEKYLNDFWKKGFLTQAEEDWLKGYKAKNKLTTEEVINIENNIKNKYRDKIKMAEYYQDKEEENVENWTIEEHLKDKLNSSSCVDKEKEIEELLSYLMSSDKMEQNMAVWALLNIFKFLKQSLNEGDTEWATPSFIRSLKRAREIIPKDKIRIINLIDSILNNLMDS